VSRWAAISDRGGRVAAALLALASLCLGGGSSFTPGTALAQESSSATTATLDSTLEAGEADAALPKRRMVKWNEYDGPVSTLRFGYHFMYDFASYVQDDESKQQVSMPTDNGVRDFRVLAKGRFKTDRKITWTLGYMYDGAEDEWRFRQTGFQVDVPELSGQFFLGRTKEGFSLIKVMTGSFIWGIERSQTLDAFVPILGDGIKYMGYYPRQRVVLNLGLFADALSENEKFSTYDNQFVTRLAWQPVLSEETHTVGHVGFMTRNATPDDGFLREKSKPGSYLAPNVLDTGKFPADRTHTYGVEAFYRRGPWLFGGEYDWQKDHAKSGEKPLFHGGDAWVAWLITGETRAYNAPGGFFTFVTPRKSVFQGGPGALEAVLHFSRADFDDGASFQGGKFWRFSPMLHWHLSEYQRLEFVYGYGKLDRFGLNGGTQFFQARILTML
jgi:phosphate-selective porin OprO/OprP